MNTNLILTAKSRAAQVTRDDPTLARARKINKAKPTALRCPKCNKQSVSPTTGYCSKCGHYCLECRSL